MPMSSNAAELASGMRRESRTAQGKVDRIRKTQALLLETKIKGNASGRPGPRVISGDYRRSWNTRHGADASVVGTNKPQARRLEFGFVGPDRIGRVYNQKPLPHVGPAVPVVRKSYAQALKTIPDLGV